MPPRHQNESGNKLTLAIGVFVAALGAVVLLGWYFNYAPAKSVFPGLTTMKANAALGFVLCGFSLAALSRRKAADSNSRWIHLAASLLIALGAITLGEYLFGWNLGLEKWLFSEPSSPADLYRAGRMSPSSAFCFILTGAALIAAIQNWSSRAKHTVPAALGVAVMVIGAIALAAYASDIVFSFRWWSYTGMAVHTAAGFMLMGLGLLAFSTSGQNLTWSLDRQTTAGFSVGIASLVVAAGLSYYFTSQLQKGATQVDRTQEILKNIGEITATVASIGSGQRSYVNTGDASYLDRESALKGALDRELESLRALTADDSQQKPRIDRLASLISQRMDWGQQTVSARREAGLAGAERLIATGKGIEIADGIRREIKGLQDDGYTMLDHQRASETAVSNTTFLLLPLGLFISVTLLSMCLFFLNVGMGERRHAQEKAIWLGSFPERHPSPIVEADLRLGVIHYQNPFAERLLPKLPALGLQHPWLKGLEDITVLLAAKPDEPHRREVSIGGSVYAQIISYIPESGRVRVYGTDITAQKEAQEELWASEARLDFAMEASHTGAWEFSLVDGKSTRTPTHDRIFGYADSASDWSYERFLEHVVPDDREQVDRRFREAEKERNNWNFECRIRRVDGVMRWIWGAGGYEHDANGRPVRMAGLVKDITERKEIESNSLRLAAIVDHSDDVIIGKDLDGVIFSWNLGAEKTFGFAAAEMIGQSITLIIPPWRLPEDADILARIRRGETIKPFDTVRLCKDGGELPISITVSPVKDVSGTIVGASIVGRDITERLRVESASRESHENLERKVAERTAQFQFAKERAEAAGRAKSEFMASMSHELRTPLNGIIGFSEFLVDGKPGAINPRQKEYLEDILNSGRHLLQLINDVLDLAKVEAGKIEFNAEIFPIRKALAEVCSVAGPIAQKKHIQVGVSIAQELVEVRLDQMRFKQVVYNLLSNALKFTDNGGRVEIQCAPISAHQFRLAVTDTGIGIRPQDLTRLFREFEQIESGAGRHYGGTGLGLALTRKMLEMQGGKIDVESEFGKGSTFTAVLPLVFEEVLS